MSAVEVMKESLADRKPSRIMVGETAVCVAKIGSEIFAIADMCTHSEASLSEGEISGESIECWLHGAAFDLRTGEALTPPAVEAVETFSILDKGTSVVISKKGK